jgi:putative DNA primase/helicase
VSPAPLALVRSGAALPLSLADLEAVGRAEVRAHLAAVTTSTAHRRPVVGVSLTRATDVILEPIAWLWDGWLARGKVHLIAGAPGTGKTTLGLAFAAILTRGGHWPDGPVAPLGDVALWSGEDTPGDVLVPRLIAAGADPARVHLVSGFTTERGARAFDPATDIGALSARLARMDPAPLLLIVDPLVSAVTGDSHKNAEVRSALQPLVDLAAERGIAVLGVSHFSKGTQGRDPTERVTGSLAFGALARVVLATAKLADEQGGGCILVRAKSNLGPDHGGFAYHLVVGELAEHPGISATRVVWGEVLEGNARDLLGRADERRGPDATSEAADLESFIRGCLAAGPVSAKQMQEDASGAGYSWDRVKRVAHRIGIERRKEGYQGSWSWSLPAERAPEDAKGSKGSTLRRVHSLHPLDDSAPSSAAGPDPQAAPRLPPRKTTLALKAAEAAIVEAIQT